MFHVGQKCICIAESWYCPRGYVQPVKGTVYTVRAIFPGIHNPEDRYLHLCEIVNPPRIFTDDVGEGRFHSAMFRPVVERKTDISIFEALLTPAGKQNVVVYHYSRFED